MIKKALQYIVGLGEAKQVVIDGTTYTDKTLNPVYSSKITDCFETATLTSVVDCIKNNVDGLYTDHTQAAIIHIESPMKLTVKSQVYDVSCARDKYIVAEANLPRFSFGQWYDAESFNIAMQSKFIQNEDRDIILKVVGNLKEDAVRTIGDDGVSQSVTTKTGIATVADVKVPNPVRLRPFRTFLEVEQPESKFIFRMQNGARCGLFEADGGAWEMVAIRKIKEYLEFELSEQIKDGAVIILA